MSMKLLCLYLVQHLLHQIKAKQFYFNLDLYQQLSSKKIEEFKDFLRLLSDFPVLFEGRFDFQGLFKKAL